MWLRASMLSGAKVATLARFAFACQATAIVAPAHASQEAGGRHAMVVSRHQEASRVGAEILREGGNAVDAAVAVSMALAVVLPQAGNLGGGGFLLFRRQSDGFATAIDYRETAPAAAHRDAYLDANGELDTLRVRTGHQAAGVPGTVAGLHFAWSKYGKLPWNRLLEPAIELATEGFEVNDELARLIGEERARLAQFPTAAALFLDDGKPLSAGRRIVQPELAQTLRAIATGGPEAFYTGSIAAMLASEMQRGGGWITLADLAAYRPVEREVLRGRYRDLEILGMPPPSSGGVTLLQILGMLDGFDLANYQPRPAIPVHLVAEAMALAFADRNTFLGDPDFVSIPLDALLSPEYLAQRRSMISLDRATPGRFVKPGNPLAVAAPAGGDSAVIDSTQVRPEHDETTHVSIVDPDGNAVAMTTTLNGNFGSGVIVAGFLLNNEMDDFDARPGTANQFGLVGGEANAIAPGKRMLSSMTPTIVLREGRVWLVLGARGGPRIITAIAQIIIAMRDFALDLRSAVVAKRFHHQWLPGALQYEDGALPEEARQLLLRMGHDLRVLRPNPSSVQCIEITPDGDLRGVSDPRVQGAAVGY